MKKELSVNDPIPLRVLGKFYESVSECNLKTAELSVSPGCFPSHFQHATITPNPNGKHLESDELKNYRPVSNLPFLSKLIEKVVSSQLITHLAANILLSKHQSGYKKYHSCETAFITVINDTQTIISQRKLAMFLALDLSVAFDTIDHARLLNKLKVK